MDTSTTLPSPPDDNQLTLALHQQIQAIAARPLDAGMLLELEKTCALARQLLLVSKEPAAGERGAMIGGMGNYMSSYAGVGSYEYAAPAISSPQETFGVTAIRELVSALPALFPKPPEPIVIPEPPMNYVQVLDAIKIAEERGEEQCASQLRQAFARALNQGRELPPTEVTSGAPSDSVEAA
jgi:hypothetical protein